MGQHEKKLSLRVDGMTCSACEIRIESALSGLQGVFSVKADRQKRSVEIVYIFGQTSEEKIKNEIEAAGYKVTPVGIQTGSTLREYSVRNEAQSEVWKNGQGIILVLLIFVLFWMLQKISGVTLIPEITSEASYGIIFLVGLITSVHCIAMCGGINLSQCIQREDQVLHQGYHSAAMKPSLQYNAGRVVSYTVLGGVVGMLGQVIGFDNSAKGFVTIVAGAFMILMGLNLMGAGSWAGKLIPRPPAFLKNKLNRHKRSQKPFLVGLLNGFMPCGPLQSMQLYALGTGSFSAGALSMLAFSLGTVPLMFGMGFLSTLISRSVSQKLFRLSAIMVLALGVIMTGRGLSLAGISFNPGVTEIEMETLEDYGQIAVVQDGVQTVTIELHPGYYEPIVVQKGIPVRFNIEAAEGSLNSCNDAVQIPEFNIQKPLMVGDNWIEFVPEQAGVIPFSCWMGMIRSEILVVDSLNNTK